MAWTVFLLNIYIYIPFANVDVSVAFEFCEAAEMIETGVSSLLTCHNGLMLGLYRSLCYQHQSDAGPVIVHYHYGMLRGFKV